MVLQKNRSYKKQFELASYLNVLKKKIDDISDTGSTLMLKKILINLRNLGEKLDQILKYFNEDISLYNTGSTGIPRGGSTTTSGRTRHHQDQADRYLRQWIFSGKTITTFLPIIVNAAASSEPMKPPPITRKRSPCSVAVRSRW